LQYAPFVRKIRFISNLTNLTLFSEMRRQCAPFNSTGSRARRSLSLLRLHYSYISLSGVTPFRLQLFSLPPAYAGMGTPVFAVFASLSALYVRHEAQFRPAGKYCRYKDPNRLIRMIFR
jgi:hypothetical protein